MSQGLVVVGGQWGDEGKGKVVDVLTAGFSCVVRYNGGHNAGHTVRVGDSTFALHLVPSGIVRPGVECLVGAGVVVDPVCLVEELEAIRRLGVDVEGRIVISEKAPLVLPTHRLLDAAREAWRGAGRIGTTGRGIGPAYQDLAARRAVRAVVLKAGRETVLAEARRLAESHIAELRMMGSEAPHELELLLENFAAAAEAVAPMVGEVERRLQEHVANGSKVLFEGAQGVLLDLFHGTYPFVTSSTCLPGFVHVSVPGWRGNPPFVLGVFKAYATRVGRGPFPTEEAGPIGDHLREAGAEYGTTTGRPRRCGWFDAVAARYAVRMAGIDGLAITKLDVLDGLDEVKVAAAYRAGGELLEDKLPATANGLKSVEPVYRTFKGWSGSKGVRSWKELPQGAREYVEFLEEQLGAPVEMVSTGAKRGDVVFRPGGFLEKLVGEQKETTATGQSR